MTPPALASRRARGKPGKAAAISATATAQTGSRPTTGCWPGRVDEFTRNDWQLFGVEPLACDDRVWGGKRSLGREQTPGVIKSPSLCWVLTTSVRGYCYNVAGRPIRWEVKEIDRVSGAK